MFYRKKKCPAPLTDAQLRYRLYAQGFYDSQITPELIKAQRKIMEARMRLPLRPKKVRTLIEGDYD